MYALFFLAGYSNISIVRKTRVARNCDGRNCRLIWKMLEFLKASYKGKDSFLEVYFRKIFLLTEQSLVKVLLT